MMGGPLDFLVRASVSPTDGVEEVACKRRLVLVLWLGLLGMVTYVGITLSTAQELKLNVLAVVFGMACFISLYFVMCATKCALGPKCYGAFSAAAVIMIIAADLESASAQKERTWPGMVLVLDLLLVNNAPRFLSTCVVAVGLVWLVLVEMEKAIRYGLFDIPFLSSQAARHELYSCEMLPCSRESHEFVDCLLLAAVVYVGDFLVTRGFATRLMVETRAMERTCHVTQLIARNLACYDLAQAQEILDAHADELPSDLLRALQELLDNLHRYRPLLPHIMFELVASTDDNDMGTGVGDTVHPARPSVDAASSVGVREANTVAVFHHAVDMDEAMDRRLDGRAPGIEGPAAIAFTDIIGSTKLWESCPDAMDTALQMHDRICRRTLRRYGGYEVKTVGDSFMLTFPDVIDALRFGVNFNIVLLNAPWPTEILEMPACRREGKIWAGLHLRIGVSYGDLNPRINIVTGRYDYFGPVVNKAARLESISGAGLVTVDMASVSPVLRWKLEEEDISLEELGAYKLRGFDGEIDIGVVFHKTLKDRRFASPDDTDIVWPHHSHHLRPDSSTSNGTTLWSSPRSNAHSAFSRHLSTGLQNRSAACIARVMFNGHVGNTGNVGPECVDGKLVQTGVSTAIMCANRCGGTVVTFDGSIFTAGWGLTHGPQDSFVSSVRFVTLMRRQLDPNALASSPTSARRCVGMPTTSTGIPSAPSSSSTAFYAAVTSGAVQFGCVGTSSTQMIAVVGRVMDLGLALVQAATRMNVNSLTGAFNNLGHGGHPTLRQFLEPFPYPIPGDFSETVVHQLIETRAVQIWSDKTLFQKMLSSPSHTHTETDIESSSQCSSEPTRFPSASPGRQLSTTGLLVASISPKSQSACRLSSSFLDAM